MELVTLLVLVPEGKSIGFYMSIVSSVQVLCILKPQEQRAGKHERTNTMFSSERVLALDYTFKAHLLLLPTFLILSL